MVRLLTMSTPAFTSAAGNPKHTKHYDTIVKLITREKLWRAEVIRQLRLAPGQCVADVGCGTASQAVLIKQRYPQVRVVGVDPDPEVLQIARAKVARAGVDVDLRIGMGDHALDLLGPETVDRAVSSLVLHQCPMPMKSTILDAMFAVLRPGGELVIADYGWQRTTAMRLVFRYVQMVDGRSDTQPNADGIVPELIARAGFQGVTEAAVFPTVSGSISVYHAFKPQQGR